MILKTNIFSVAFFVLLFEGSESGLILQGILGNIQSASKYIMHFELLCGKYRVGSLSDPLLIQGYFSSVHLGR